MELLLRREAPTSSSTPGRLYYLNGSAEAPLGFTLEDILRPDGVKVDGKTAIPAGRYLVQNTFSNRFQKTFPLLCGVPNFSGVRIHGGNTSADTEGCILVGKYRENPDRISGCLDVVVRVTQLVMAATARKEPVYITVENPK